MGSPGGYETGGQANAGRLIPVARLNRSWGCEMAEYFARYVVVFMIVLLLGAVPGPAAAPLGRIAYVAGDQLWVMNGDGSQAGKVCNLHDSYTPVWSPDSRRLAFVRLGRIQILTLEQGKVETVAGPAEVLEGIDWSPDGREIAYATLDSRSIWLHNLGSGKQRKVTTSNRYAWNPSFSPDGRSLVFFTGDYEAGSVAMVKTDGSGFKKICTDGSYPAWSRDGKLIAYIKDGDIWVCSTAGKNPHRVFQMKDGNCKHPSWSPDSRTLAFRGESEAGMHIYRVGIDGGGFIRLSPPGDENYSDPCWSRR